MYQESQQELRDAESRVKELKSYKNAREYSRNEDIGEEMYDMGYDYGAYQRNELPEEVSNHVSSVIRQFWDTDISSAKHEAELAKEKGKMAMYIFTGASQGAELPGSTAKEVRREIDALRDNVIKENMSKLKNAKTRDEAYDYWYRINFYKDLGYSDVGKKIMDDAINMYNSK